MIDLYHRARCYARIIGFVLYAGMPPWLGGRKWDKASIDRGVDWALEPLRQVKGEI